MKNSITSNNTALEAGAKMTVVLIANIEAVIAIVTVKITLAYHFAVFIIGGFYLINNN